MYVVACLPWRHGFGWATWMHPTLDRILFLSPRILTIMIERGLIPRENALSPQRIV
jgi:hypothetical protein